MALFRWTSEKSSGIVLSSWRSSTRVDSRRWLPTGWHLSVSGATGELRCAHTWVHLHMQHDLREKIKVWKLIIYAFRPLGDIGYCEWATSLGRGSPPRAFPSSVSTTLSSGHWLFPPLEGVPVHHQLYRVQIYLVSFVTLHESIIVID